MRSNPSTTPSNPVVWWLIVGAAVVVVAARSSVWLNFPLHRGIFSPRNYFRCFYKQFTLETGLLLGVGMVLLGSLILGVLVIRWLNANLQLLPNPEWASLGATLVILGFSAVFSSLFISAMSMKKLELYQQDE